MFFFVCTGQDLSPTLSAMVFELDRDGVFECRKSNEEGGGTGVFCVGEVEAGTILPYYGVAIRDGDEKGECVDDCANYRTYVVAADYTTRRGNQRSLKGYSVDGDPTLPEIRNLEEYKKIACRINEATDRSPPNCLLVGNPRISRDDIKRSFFKRKPIPVTLVVTLEDLRKGTELLTCYGDEYGAREYTPCNMTRSLSRKLVDRAYQHLDALPLTL